MSLSRYHSGFFFTFVKTQIMKVKILKTVLSGNTWRNEGDIIELKGSELNHYLANKIAIEQKEEKAPKTTKEDKTVKKRTTKKVKK